MAISTRSELESAIADYLARSDLTTSQLRNFIVQFEAVANRRLRVRQMEAEDTIDTTSGEDTLPTDYLTWRSLTWDGDTTADMEFLHPTAFRNRHPTTNDGTPSVFTIEGENINIRPVDDTTTYTLRYYQKLDALDADGATNWLLTDNPDCYLAGCLVEANAFLMNEKAALLWKARRDEIF